MHAADATSGAGDCGHSGSIPNQDTKVAAATASVIKDVSNVLEDVKKSQEPLWRIWMPRVSHLI
jgi:hypothetical protein